jgi:pimeloyl-ACP methyl ester carboxylesterase
MNPPIVLVHGAWHGGWCWARLRPLLEAAGFRVFTPTLTGLGERAHLRSPVPTLRTHVDDIVGLITAEELQEVVLVGHSYAGMIVTGVADRLRERIRHLVYLDAAVPGDGDSFASHIPGMSAEAVDRRISAFKAMASDGAWLPPPSPDVVGVADPEDAAWLARRLGPHPLSTWLEPLRLANGGHAGIPKTYVLATKPMTSVMGYPLHADIAGRGGEWSLRKIECGHDMMVVEAGRTAELIVEAARMPNQAPCR